MHGTVAVTDFDWYEFLARRNPPEVNFWNPSDRRKFSAPEFSPFFFKLKAPHRAIAGFAYFAKWSSLPTWLAWDCFGEGNGCATLGQLEDRLAKIRGRIRYSQAEDSASIGCTLLVQPVFFPRDAWIPQPADWHDRTVSSARYDLTRGEGQRLWAECQERVALSDRAVAALPQVAGDAPRWGAPQTVMPRLGQGAFRVSVTDAYDRACTVTNEHSLPALEAAHIRSYAHEGPHDIRNGLLLRADLHQLLDKGYVTVTERHALEVSSRLRSDFGNGKTYYPLHGQPVRLPAAQEHRPAPEFLRWHNEQVYRG